MMRTPKFCRSTKAGRCLLVPLERTTGGQVAGIGISVDGWSS